MRLGALLTFTKGDNPNDIVEQARRYEGEGYASIWAAHAMGRGLMLTDPFVALAAVAAVTEKVEIGTAILQLPLYNPTDIALKALSLQQLAGGRLVLGVGAGSTESDYIIHNVPFTDRFKLFEEKVDKINEIFRTGCVGEHGLSPWPSVRKGVPLFFGTWGKNVPRAALDFNGWIASGMHRTPEQCAAALDRYRQSNGQRAIVSTIQVNGDTDLGELAERLAGYRESGFDDAVVILQSGAPDPAVVRKLV
jgi:alkanesulfonate monooxygenase SsuD/methylene tetrahydromethanopterin reductase-like flavin-dependent oxidoreductase (luciferase family)